jgi:putative sigma-54 modulation protein
VEPSDTLKEYALERIQRLKKHFDGLVEGHVVLSQEKIRHMAELTLAANGLRMNAKEEGADFYAVIDSVITKVERQLVRHKGKLKHHRPASNRERRSMKENIYEYESFATEAGPRILQTEHYTTHPRSIDEAVMEIDLTEQPFLVFTDSDNKVKVVYRREDGNYGLIEPE